MFSINDVRITTYPYEKQNFELSLRTKHKNTKIVSKYITDKNIKSIKLPGKNIQWK